MSDYFDTVRLSGGQLAQMQEGGTLRVIAPKEVPQHHFLMNVAHIREPEKAVTKVVANTYDDLVRFLKQLENIDYLLLNIERVDGVIPRQN